MTRTYQAKWVRFYKDFLSTEAFLVLDLPKYRPSVLLVLIKYYHISININIYYYLYFFSFLSFVLVRVFSLYLNDFSLLEVLLLKRTSRFFRYAHFGTLIPQGTRRQNPTVQSKMQSRLRLPSYYPSNTIIGVLLRFEKILSTRTTMTYVGS